MKVSELIALLQAMPADADVMVNWGGTLNEGTSSVTGAKYELDQYEILTAIRKRAPST